MPSQLAALRAVTRTSTWGVGLGDGGGATAAVEGAADGVRWACAAAAAPFEAVAWREPPEPSGHSCTAATRPTAASAPSSAIDQFGPVRTAPFAPPRKAAGRSLRAGPP